MFITWAIFFSFLALVCALWGMDEWDRDRVRSMPVFLLAVSFIFGAIVSVQGSQAQYRYCNAEINADTVQYLTDNPECQEWVLRD